MKYIDAHVHIGDADLVRKYVYTSFYRDKIRLYSALNEEVVKKQEEFIGFCEKCFGLPIVLKEIGIKEANDYLEKFAKTHKKCVPCFLIGDDIDRYKRNSSRILKEHFLHHPTEEWRDRHDSYQYLNDIKGYLLIHCADADRIEYVQLLRQEYPSMKIIIAHMGRNVYEDVSFSKNVIDSFKDDDMIYYDTSTIKNEEIIIYAINTIGDDRILYGTDFPYEFEVDWDLSTTLDALLIARLSQESLDKIMYYNAKKILDEK